MKVRIIYNKSLLTEKPNFSLKKLVFDTEAFLLSRKQLLWKLRLQMIPTQECAEKYTVEIFNKKDKTVFKVTYIFGEDSDQEEGDIAFYIGI